jgi:diguanylate cyclase (GGDEF)-like protein
LLNRKTFDEKVLRIITSLRATDSQPDGRGAYCLAILDVDHFKRVNDRFGHLYGDEVLLLFARTMVEAFRGGDLLFRIGGEEFVVVLKDVDLNRALAVLERFRQTVETFPFPQVGQITASIGVSMITSGDLPSTVIDRADKALYYAKNNGRNQVSVYETLIAEKKLSAAVDDSDVELF